MNKQYWALRQALATVGSYRRRCRARARAPVPPPAARPERARRMTLFFIRPFSPVASTAPVTVSLAPARIVTPGGRYR